jgi:hypothetical protein
VTFQSAYRTFARSWAGAVFFILLMSACAWFLYATMSGSLRSYRFNVTAFDFPTISLTVIWTLFARSRKWPKRFVLPYLLAVGCWMLSTRAAHLFQPSMTAADAHRATLYFAAYYTAMLLWLAFFPRDNVANSPDTSWMVGNWQLRLWTLLAGGAIMLAGYPVYSHGVAAYLNMHVSDGFPLARETLFCMSLALVVLIMVRAVAGLLVARKSEPIGAVPVIPSEVS